MSTPTAPPLNAGVLPQPPGCCPALYDLYSTRQTVCNDPFPAPTLIGSGVSPIGPVETWVDQGVNWADNSQTFLYYAPAGSPAPDPAGCGLCQACYNLYTSQWDCDLQQWGEPFPAATYVSGPGLPNWVGDCTGPGSGSVDIILPVIDPAPTAPAIGDTPAGNCGGCP